MILLSVLYPNQPGTHFDERYYVDRHIPALGAVCEEIRSRTREGSAAGS